MATYDANAEDLSPAQLLLRKLRCHASAKRWAAVEVLLLEYETSLASPVPRGQSAEPTPAEIGLCLRTVNLLEAAGVMTVAQLANLKESQLLRIPGIGPGAAGEVFAALRRYREADGYLDTIHS